MRGYRITHVAVFLAYVARLEGRLDAVYIFCDGIGRSQTVLRAYEMSTTKHGVCALRACVPRHIVRPAATVALDGRERSDVKITSRQ